MAEAGDFYNEGKAPETKSEKEKKKSQLFWHSIGMIRDTNNIAELELATECLNRLNAKLDIEDILKNKSSISVTIKTEDESIELKNLGIWIFVSLVRGVGNGHITKPIDAEEYIKTFMRFANEPMFAKILADSRRLLSEDLKPAFNNERYLAFIFATRMYFDRSIDKQKWEQTGLLDGLDSDSKKELALACLHNIEIACERGMLDIEPTGYKKQRDAAIYPAVVECIKEGTVNINVFPGVFIQQLTWSISRFINDNGGLPADSDEFDMTLACQEFAKRYNEFMAIEDFIDINKVSRYRWMCRGKIGLSTTEVHQR